MKLKNFLRTGLLILTIFWLNYGVYSQIAGENFQSKISADSQKELANRVDLFIKYQQLKDWEKLFDLLDEKRDKKTFIADQKKSPNDANFFLMEFSSLKATFDDSTPDWLIIYGCATIHQGNGKDKKLKAFINAYKVNEIWIFTMLEFVRQVGQKPETCECSK